MQQALEGAVQETSVPGVVEATGMVTRLWPREIDGSCGRRCNSSLFSTRCDGSRRRKRGWFNFLVYVAIMSCGLSKCALHTSLVSLGEALMG